jgi:hypothetical protein
MKLEEGVVEEVFGDCYLSEVSRVILDRAEVGKVGDVVRELLAL